MAQYFWKGFPGLGGLSDQAFPSILNRPIFRDAPTTTAAQPNNSVLAWTGPLGGGPNNGNPVRQFLTLTNDNTGPTVTANTSGFNFTNGVSIGASNITVKQCAVWVDGLFVAFVADGTDGSVFEDCLFYGPGANTTNPGSENGGFGVVIGNLSSGTGVKNFIMRRCNLHHCRANLYFGSGVVAGSTIQILDTWIHDQDDGSSGGSHFDGVYMGGNQTGAGACGNLLLQHNAIYNDLYTQSACILGETANGPLDNVTINNNIIHAPSGTNFGITCNEFNGGSGFNGIIPQNIKWTNNRIIAPTYATRVTATGANPNVTISGNTDFNTGANIDSLM